MLGYAGVQKVLSAERWKATGQWFLGCLVFFNFVLGFFPTTSSALLLPYYEDLKRDTSVLTGGYCQCCSIWSVIEW